MDQKETTRGLRSVMREMNEQSDELQQEPRDDNITCEPQTIKILLDGDFNFMDYLENHVSSYRKLHPHVDIQLEQVDGNYNVLQSKLLATTRPESSSNSTVSWDASIFPHHITGALVDSNILWDWEEFVQQQDDFEVSPTESSESSPKNNRRGSGGNTILRWPDVLPFFRNEAAQYDNQVKVLPLDGDLLLMYYRKDLLEQHGLQVPRTWDEYTQVAEYFHNRPLGPSNETMYGSCISRRRGCGNPYWTNLVLSSMTQSLGTSSGFFMDPSSEVTSYSSTPRYWQWNLGEREDDIAAEDSSDDDQDWDPLLLGPAMEETLRYTTEQFRSGHPDELNGELSCLAMNYLFNYGRCALTINWGNQLLGLLDGDLGTKVGVAPTPGSRLVLDRTTRKLANCSAVTCPNGIWYDDLGLVNTAPYAAFGGWVAGVNNNIDSEKQETVANFLSYISNPSQSITDVLPNERTTLFQPYRYSQLQAPLWFGRGDESDNAAPVGLISDFSRATRHGFVDSKNTVLDLRIPEGGEIRQIVDKEVYSFLEAYAEFGNVTAQHRTKKTKQIEEQILAVLDLERQEQILQDRARVEIGSMVEGIRGELTVMERYQQSLNIFPARENPNYIESSLRMAGWGLGGIVCFGALIMLIWTLWYRSHRVIVASQANILMQSAVGIFFIGLTIPLLSMDESLGLDQYMLDHTCMVIPACYCLGFSILFSAIYAKIRQCIKVYSDPRRHHNVLLVPTGSALKLCFRLVMMNGALLFIWHTVDRLRWQRLEVPGSLASPMGLGEEDGGGHARITKPDTYGTCRGDSIAYIGFAGLTFVVNQTMLIFAILQAFKCRFLTVEFHEMQWLPLALVPMVEAWFVGAPILFLVQTDPTGIFVVLTMVISFSAFGAMLAIFAPKEWYIRKDFHDFEAKKARQRPYPVGVVVLSHPDVVDAREIERLQLMLDNFNSSNMELEQEIFAIKAKLAEVAAAEARAAASSNLGAEGSRPRLLPGASRAEIERSMNTIKEKCDEILSMADDDFSDSEWSDEPEENTENENFTELLMEGMNDPEFTERSPSQRGPDSWRAPSVSDPSPDSWRAPSELSPDSWRAPEVSENGDATDDIYGYGVTDTKKVDAYGYGAPEGATPQPGRNGPERAPEDRKTPKVHMDSLVATPNSSLSVYEDSNSRDHSRAMPTTSNSLPSASPNRSLSVFEDSPAKEADGSNFSAHGYTHPYSQDSPTAFSMFSHGMEDAPSSVGAASTSAGMSTTLSLSMDDYSNASFLAPGPQTGDSKRPRSADLKRVSASTANTVDTQRSPSTATTEADGAESGRGRKQPFSTDELSQFSSGSDDSECLIQKKEYSGLNSALEADDLEAIEANASMLAESLKAKLNDTALSDYGDEPMVTEDLSVKICASFDTDAGESMADHILNSLLSPENETDPSIALDVPIMDSSTGSSSGSSNQKPILSAGESSAAEVKYRVTAMSMSSDGLVRDFENMNGGRHTQKAGEPSRGDYLHSAEAEGTGRVRMREVDPNSSHDVGAAAGGKIEHIVRGHMEHGMVILPTHKPKRVRDSKGYAQLGVQQVGAKRIAQGGKVPRASKSKHSWSQADNLKLHIPKDGNPASSFEVGDWEARGVTASVLADDTDSQSTSTHGNESASSSVDATRSASALDTPLAQELDKLVGSLDWDGIKDAAKKYERTIEPPPASLEEKRRRKREIEAWRTSITESFSRSPD